MTRFAGRLRRALPFEAFVLTALVVAFFLPFLLSGKIPLLRYLFYSFYPDWVYYKECLSQFRLPFWNPHTGCGEPFLANSETATLYPLNCLFLLMPVGVAAVIWMLLHHLIAGWGVFCACRMWRVSARGALLASVSFVFGTAMITRMEFAPSFAAFAWYPFCIAVYALWLERRRLWIMLLLVVLMSVQYYAGWPEAAVFTGLSLGLYAAAAGFYAWGRAGGRISQLFLPAGCVLGAGAVALMLSMAQMLPQLELIRLSARGGAVDPQLHFGSVHPLALCTLLIPSLYGIPGYFLSHRYWAPSAFEYEVGAMYAGVVPVIILIMAGVAYILGRPPRNERPHKPPESPVPAAVIFLIVLLAFSFLYAMGRYSLFYPTVREIVTPLKKFRWPAKILPCFDFALCCLAGMGLDRLSGLAAGMSGLPRWRAAAARWAPQAIIAAGAAAALVCAVNPGGWGVHVLDTVFNFKMVPEPFRNGLPLQRVASDCVFFAATACVAAGVLYAYAFRPALRRAAWRALLAVALFDLLRVAVPLVPAGDRELFDNVNVAMPLRASGEEPFRFRTDDCCFAAYLYGRSDPALYWLARGTLFGGWAQASGGFNVEPHGNTKTLSCYTFARIVDDHRVNAEVRRGLLRMVNCRIDVTFPHEVLSSWRNTAVPMTFVPVEGALPRAFVVGHVTYCTDDDEVFRVMRSQPVDYARTALVSGEEYRPEDFAWLPSGKVEHTFDDIRYGINDMSVSVRSEAEGLLVISDSYYSGWKATVNGRAARICRVNGAFRGVRVPEGRSMVRLSYFPSSFKWGALATIVSLIAVAALMCVSVIRDRKRGSDLPRK